MGVLRKRGNIWYIDVRAGNRRIRKRIGTSKKVAEMALKDAEVKIAREEFGFARQDIAIDAFFERFLEHSRANNAPSSYKRYRAVIDHFERFLHEKTSIAKLSKITAREIDEYKVFRKNEWVNPNGKRVTADEEVNRHTRKGARAKTINFEVNTLRTIFNVAIRWGYLKDNPTKEVKRLKVDDSQAPRFLTVKECKALLAAVSPEFYPIFYTFLNTGMRRGELENLEWADVDFRRKKVRIRHKDFWRPKTGEREIPMSKSVAALLKKLKSKNDRTHRANFVFTGKEGGKLKDTVRAELIRAARKARIPNLTKIHTLRHTFASHLVMNGVDLPTVQKLMGHSDIQTTMIYAHLAPDHLSDAVNKLSFS